MNASHDEFRHRNVRFLAFNVVQTYGAGRMRGLL